MDKSRNNENEHHGKPLRVVGKPFRKVDARAKCTGQTKFADDIVLPRMLFAKPLRAHEPHARIVTIDTPQARATPLRPRAAAPALRQTPARALTARAHR